ncbi:hypothetical protein WN944_029664 [Citrus x changshan-huyou]|uniref:Uncharacterized protein n=1 Tax=Citrus x changshan-huyou TaxID=2935761 RepID=A0AAP0Q957_9ROSI
MYHNKHFCWPWIDHMQDHKVIGISNFFLFVEGKATSPAVSKSVSQFRGKGYIQNKRTRGTTSQKVSVY